MQEKRVPTPLDLNKIIAGLPEGSLVVDCGCTNWRIADVCQRSKLGLIGLDRSEPPGKPSWAQFASLNNAKTNLKNDLSNLTVISHVLEHMSDSVAFFVEMVRITAPGNLLWVEAPSELSTLPNSSNNPYDHSFLNFWDDPTHVRPWTPGSLYRLALSCRCLPLAIERGVAGSIPVVRMLARKPKNIQGIPPTKYVSLEFLPSNLESAWDHIWGETLEE